MNTKMKKTFFNKNVLKRNKTTQKEYVFKINLNIQNNKNGLEGKAKLRHSGQHYTIVERVPLVKM